MDKAELGSFLRTRRERLIPQDVGMPSGSRRRAVGLRREEVAVLAHISTEYYVRLEQGRAPRPSATVCESIAGALRLTEAETDHLFLLAGTARTHRALHRRDVRPSILALVQNLPLTAAIVVSAAYEVLAWNDLAVALMEDFAVLPPVERNLARRAFLGPQGAPPPFGIAEDAAFRQNVVTRLRATRARYCEDPAITGLVDELIDGSSEFARLWARHDVRATPALTKTFTTTRVGPVTVDCDSLLLSERDQHLVLYSAPAGSPAADALAVLAVVGRESFSDS